MIQKDLLSGSKLLLILILTLFCLEGEAQRKKKRPKPPGQIDSFLDTQFWLGLTFGTNLTSPSTDEFVPGFSPLNYEAENLEKTYESFQTAGAHVGLEMNFYHKGFSVSFQPTVKRSNYNYSSGLLWQGESASSQFEVIYDIEQRLDLLELPLVAKFDVIQEGKIRPFIMAGGFYSVPLSAQKDVTLTNIDYSSGNPLTSSGGTATLGTIDAFQPFFGWTAGGGVNLDYWNIRTIIEIGYMQSLTSVTQPSIQQDELSALGIVNDGLTIQDLSFSVSFVFPFRYIDKTYQPY